MDTIAVEKRLPADIDAQPVVQAAAALYPALREYREEIEREQRLPKAAGRADARGRLLPHGDPARARRAGGRPADLSARGRAVGRRRAARSAGTSPTTASASSSPWACRTRASRRSMATARHDGRHRGAGRRAGSAGRGRLPGQRALELRQRLPRSLLDARQLPDPRRRKAAAQPGGQAAVTGAASSRAPRPRSSPAAGMSPGCAAPAASTGQWTTCSCRSGERWCMPASRSTTNGRAGPGSPTSCRPSAGSGRTTAP